MITGLLARYAVAHPRAGAALDVASRAAVRAAPCLPVLYWFTGVFYGGLALLCALAALWPGVALFTAGGVVSWWCVRRIQVETRDLERLLREQSAERGER